MPAAFGLFLVSFADEILTARAFAGKRGEHVRASQELLTMGAANAAAGFTQAFSVGASGARTAVNDAVGARTQIAGLFSAGAIVVILLFLTGPVQYLPQAVLGAVIVAAGINIVEPAAWRALAAIDRVEVSIAAVTTGCVVFFGVLEAIVVAVGLSIIDTVRRSARPYDAVLGWVPHLEGYRDVALHPSAEITPGVVVYRLDDRLFFANAQYVKGRVREAISAAPTETSWFVFDAEAVNHIDSTGIEALLDLTRELEKEQITLVVARLRTRMLPDFDAAGLTAAIGPEHLYPSVRLAVAAFPASRRRWHLAEQTREIRHVAADEHVSVVHGGGRDAHVECRAISGAVSAVHDATGCDDGDRVHRGTDQIGDGQAARVGGGPAVDGLGRRIPARDHARSRSSR